MSPIALEPNQCCGGGGWDSGSDLRRLPGEQSGLEGKILEVGRPKKRYLNLRLNAGNNVTADHYSPGNILGSTNITL